MTRSGAIVDQYYDRITRVALREAAQLLYSRAVGRAGPAGSTLAGLSLLMVCACAHVDLAERPSGQTHVYLGAVTVTVPSTYGELRAVDVSTLGAGVDESAFLGWRRGQFVYVRPNECQLLVIIRSPVEAEQALRILRAVEGDQLCVVDFAGTLSPRQ